MKPALVIALLWAATLTGGSVSARAPDAPLRHPAIQEVRLMMKGGVDYDVMVERVRRMEDVPALDPAAIDALRREDVPDRVLVELARRKQVVTPCPIPERTRSLRQVLEDPAIQGVLQAVDSGEATDAIVARVARSTQVPVLDARALDRLTSMGVPDPALLELVRKQEILTGCDPARAELVAAAERQQAAKQAAKQEAKQPAKQPAKQKAAPVAVSAIAITRPERAVEEAPRTVSHHADAAPETEGVGTIVVIAKSSFQIAFLEVSVDGNSVTRKGAIEEGETKPGWMLPPPPIVNLRGGEVVYESSAPVGSHEVKAAFAMSRIVQTDWDDVVEAYGQRYETTRVGPMDQKGMLPVCEVRAGQTVWSLRA